MKKRRQNQSLMAGLFLMPSLLGVAVFMAIPFGDVVLRSFLDPLGEKMVGTANFRSVWKNGAFRLAAGNTRHFLAAAIPVLFGVSFILALLVYGTGKGKRMFKISLVLPMVIPTAAMALVWKIFLCPDGILNQLLIGMTDKMWQIDWVYGETAFSVLVFTYVWKNIGYYLLLWLAGMSAIPESLYDAAKVDGAGSLARIRFITLPCLKGTMALVLGFSVIHSFRVYREAYLLAGSYPDQTIYLIPHLFSHWFLTLDVQKMCTAAVILVAAGFGGTAVIVAGVTWILRE